MRITFTGRRLALAAVLILGGVAAPLAYATIGKSGSDAARPLASPVGAASVAAAQAPTAVADNPYQFIHTMTAAQNSVCPVVVGLPNEVDFVLESVAVFDGVHGTPPTAAHIGLKYKLDAQTFREAVNGFDIPLDATGDGTGAFNLVIRPDTFANAALGDIYELSVCIDTSATIGNPNQVHVAFTGQRIVTTPTANLVLDFRARAGSAGTTLRWTTGSEADIAGFNVWRYRGAKGVKVNRSLIRAKRSGKPAGAAYSLVDRAPGAKRGLTYRLQLVDLKGKRTWYAAFAIASK